MEELKKAGKIRAIGLSNFSLEEMKAAMKFGQVDVIQPCYSLLWRYDEALLEFSRKQEISVIPYSTLAQGLLTGKYQKGAVFTDGRARAALFQPENYDRCLEVTDVLSQISAKYGKNTGPRRHCLAAANPRDYGTDCRSEKRKTGSGEFESRRLAIQ